MQRDVPLEAYIAKLETEIMAMHNSESSLGSNIYSWGCVGKLDPVWLNLVIRLELATI